MTDVRFWWIEQGGDPTRCPSFPFACHKYIVLRDADGSAHVVASDARLDQHADIAAAVAAWRARGGERGPEGGISGGGWGGERFPGLSLAFGPPPEDVVRAVRGEAEEPVAAGLPAWVEGLVRGSGCSSLDELEARAGVELAVFVDRLAGTVELERWAADGRSKQATVSIDELEGLMVRREER